MSQLLIRWSRGNWKRELLMVDYRICINNLLFVCILSVYTVFFTKLNFSFFLSKKLKRNNRPLFYYASLLTATRSEAL